MSVPVHKHIIQAEAHNSLVCALLVMLCTAAASCDDPSGPTAGKSQARIDVDWSGCGGYVPSGMTIMIHHDTSGENTRIIDNDITSATLNMSPGRHWATVFNLTEDEFDNIRFRGLDSPETAEAYAREYAGSRWHDRPLASDSYVACQPERLAADTILTAEVKTLPDGTQPEIKTIGTLHPQLLTYTLHLSVSIENISSLRATRGAVSGLASARRLSGDTSDSHGATVTQLIESDCWTCSRTSASSDLGVIKGDIRCFGLPAGHKGLPDENIFELQLLLADGKTVLRHDIPIGHLIKTSAPLPDRPANDIYLELHLDSALPPTGEDAGGGVDVWFSDWDDYEDFNMPI